MLASAVVAMERRESTSVRVPAGYARPKTSRLELVARLVPVVS